jgi:N-acetylmuramoyl-L-alanine amidase
LKSLRYVKQFNHTTADLDSYGSADVKATWSQRGFGWGALLLLVVLPGLPAHARSHHGEAWARDRYAAADRMREALNGRPPAERTRRDYQRVINAYRYIYFGAPTSTKADPSAVAAAEILVEMGRRFDDNKILNDAIAQYKFLRKEYPGSKYRADALFTIGEIYKDDLNDPVSARDTFEEFLKRYGHNRLAEDAQQAIIEIDREAAAAKMAGEKKPGREIAANTSTAKAPDANPPKTSNPGKDGQYSQAQAKDKDDDIHADSTAADSPDTHAKRLPRVTAIRHWSTPDYTRVAIDLEGEVKFGSQRISNPDRIFFDLRDTKLASTLVGKSFDVDDGFLKKIRVAQFQPERTRVVLEVDSLSTYEAFLLPNPYRLIIDIHGRDDKVSHAKLTKEEADALADVEAPPQVGANAHLSKPEVKADMKALAGKSVSKKEQIHDQPAPGETEDDSRGSAVSADAPQTIVTQTRVGGKMIKKVIVDNGDGDESPAESAKADDAPHRHASSPAPHKSDSVPDDDTVADAKASSDAAPASHAGEKSAARSSARKSDLGVHEAKPNASGDRSLIRALGLKIGKIVIDPGHGGHDTGTIGSNGLEEKDLVLDVGRRLGKMLETRLGAEVVYTRKDDTFIPLETRTAIANQQRADLFISIHANSSQDPEARGVETYYLNFTSSPDALEVAARENAVSEKSIYELQDLVKKIALKEKIEESREFAGDVQESLHSGLAAKNPGIRNRGVKKAPFIVLIGANMPSILAEISFVSNPGDERRLETSEYRQKIAESLYRGIANYASGLSGVKLASKMDKAAGQ